MNDQQFVFFYMTLREVLSVSPHKSRSQLLRKVRLGEFPEPDRIGGRCLWRSDRVAQANAEIAARADLEREERTRQARDKADRLVTARRSHVQLVAA